MPEVHYVGTTSDWDDLTIGSGNKYLTALKPNHYDEYLSWPDWR